MCCCLICKLPPLPPLPLPARLCVSPLYMSVTIIHEQTTHKGDVEKRLGQYYGSLFLFFLTFLNLPQYRVPSNPVLKQYQTLVEQLDFPEFEILGYKIDLKSWLLKEWFSPSSELVEVPEVNLSCVVSGFLVVFPCVLKCYVYD